MRNIADNIFSRAGVLAFAKAIGFDGEPYRLALDGETAVEQLGQRGTLRCLLIATDDHAHGNLSRIARHVRARCAGELQMFIFVAAQHERVCVATFCADELAILALDRGQVRAADVDALTELVPLHGESGLQLALRHARALDRRRVTKRFFDDFRGQRSRVSAAWQGIPPRLAEERDQLALLLLSRLMFLYFLQRRRFLCSNPEFFPHLLRTHFGSPHRYSFYRGVLRPLFFGVLNRRPERRTKRAAALGSLPYLNGGLFERHALERRFPLLDLADDAVRGVFEFLLERYRFTATEGAQESAVDPEMLGRVFEGLMAEGTRTSTGTFYTPARVVDRMVRSAFDVYLGQYSVHQHPQLLRDVRVLDPACGSGAFLLRALAVISERVETRRDVVARNLHGVDLQQDAALLCALRLWLCLIPDSAQAPVQPLPNLDRRIRQGDALIDPFDLAADSAPSPAVRAARRALQPLVSRYTTCDPEERQGVQRLVARQERRLSHAWLHALSGRLKHDMRELRAQAAARDLFGEVPSSALHAHAQLRELEGRARELKRVELKLKDNKAVPFFSFNVHFADAERTGFDVILCNPPWVRSHHWPKHLAASIKRRFHVCRNAGQVDLALVFLERAISLLAPGGVLAIILPAKFLRSASAGAAREFMLQRMDVLSVEDHSLDQRSIFGADAFASVIIARKKAGARSNDTSISMIRRKVAPLNYSMPTAELPFDARNPRSAWLLVPASVRTAIMNMLERGVSVQSQFAVRRGVVTGANAALIVTHAEGKLGNLAAIRSEGGVEAIIESDVLRPLVRGCDLMAWNADIRHKIIFCYDDASAHYCSPPKRTTRYLRDQLGSDHQRLGSLQHVAAAQHLSKLAWHDLANNLNAVVLPPQCSCLGNPRPIVALNTVYYISLPEVDALLLAAYFNSLPVRVFARAIAERAKDAHFRFFACTVGMLSLPAQWRIRNSDELRELAREAHDQRQLSEQRQIELDETVAAAFGLGAAALNALRRFDRWLTGAA